MDMPVNVPVDDPNADTEWNDILRKHGIIPEKPPSPTPIIEEAILEAQRRAHENRLEDKDLDELDALEDEEDEAFLEQYRKKRIAEISTLQKASIYNQVYPLQKTDYAREVTEASSNAYVLVNLTSSMGGNTESRVLSEIWRQLAGKYGEIKFCEIRADMCIEGYPERNTPTILAYKDGEIRKQFVTLRELKGVRTKIEDVEKVLVELGAVKEGDLRLRKRSESDEEEDNSQEADDGDDDDWD
ncbi:hypothetical protein UA08_04260 [Talaromyces atroroseus]|uniref:Phosducin domain-containing protein n=1 Tax=Talaromyces atroroseus TaxID=1441469 RepID=A0A1Q5Q994_TALAT|nr:hypothetical protein UA08_04260 [Talaromyces atroroseus]OKL60706.1 hypothetical protein UA08_04260 [Talaromyces atroroseus]